MKTLRLSLRRRVAIAFTVLGFVLSLSFAAATVFITEDYEHILVDEMLRGQADDYALRLAANPATELPQSHRLSGYLRRNDGQGDVPAGLGSLPPGIHEGDDYNDEGIHIGVFDTDQGRLYFVIDLSDIERLERSLESFLIGVIVVGTSLAGWLGWLLARGAIAPVRRLAEAVDALPTMPQASALTQTVSDDELGRLAASIDRYQYRLVEADTQERRFFADASHELRTPMAVVRGAAELLLDDPDLHERARGVLQRLDRGVRELTDLLDVLLDLGRRRELGYESVDVNELLREAVSFLQESGAHTCLQIRIDAKGQSWLPKRESVLLLRGVLRHLLPPDVRGILVLHGDGNLLEISYTPETDAPIAPWATALRSDTGLAMTLMGRLAAALGWQIEYSSPETTISRVRIIFEAEGAHAS